MFVAKLVTNSSAKLGYLRMFVSWSETEQQDGRRDLASIPENLTDQTQSGADGKHGKLPPPFHGRRSGEARRPQARSRRPDVVLSYCNNCCPEG